MKLAILLAALLCVAPLTAAVAPPPTEQADSDGGRSLNAFIDDGNGGVWREFPASDAGIAAFTDALNGRSIDAVAYSQDVKGAGAYLHSWTGDDGTPFVTVGAYVVSATQGKIRLPFAIVENVTDLGELSMLAASVVADDAMPIAAESFPHVYGLVAPDVLLSGILGGVGLVLVGELALTAVANVASIDGGEGAANLPPEAYPILEKASWSMIQMGFAFVFGQFGLGGTYIDNAPENLTYDWSDRPEVRIWVARKSAAGHDVWTGVAISRTGAHEGDGVSDFTAWKRISVGPVARVDGAIAAPAAAYARADVSRHYEDNADGDGPTAIENHYILT
ncbi:MAG TPA: hypothetical protein VM370_10450, partial [Candidatus Thermoplasmatota archaeon]|nr:hypothetical protein [Candidatus Thermoplasmatota archaeon]